MRLSWKWVGPPAAGRRYRRCAAGFRSREAAIESAVREASGRAVPDAATREVLWRSLERAGWRVGVQT